MKLFRCDHCRALLYFENHLCVTCGHTLAYLPDARLVASLEAVGDGQWTSPAPSARGRRYRCCANYTEHQVCNWAVPADDPNPLCVSCRLTVTSPDLSVAGHREAWYKLETAKRRLVYGLDALGLPHAPKSEDPARGLAFALLADPPQADAGGHVLTGHDNGLITLALAEADDAERERRRTQLGEPYRTLLGHFRHEVGHYYWDRLIRDDADRLAAFRSLFGDVSQDYAASLRRHYAEGAPADWQNRFVSAYASAHAWEDWAETWAHYLHLVDTLETADECGVSLHSPEGVASVAAGSAGEEPDAFSRMIARWFELTHALNNLNRGLGLADSYPFVLADPVVEKLRFIHETIRTAGAADAAVAAAPTVAAFPASAEPARAPASEAGV